ncbi:MAG: hypothetical protein Q4C59_14240 [Lachnospiraceae bacterium]|nr:hypothetical protein [Lachnospiraceae bacterium]
MKFVYEEALQKYMLQKKKSIIAVEVITSDHSDFEVTELHVHLVNSKRADFFKTKKHFRSYATEVGEVFLPPYRLEYDETIIFGLKSFLWFKYVTQQGIRL